MSFVEIAKVSDIPAGTMKHVEVGGKELCIANVNGKFHVIGEGVVMRMLGSQKAG